MAKKRQRKDGARSRKKGTEPTKDNNVSRSERAVGSSVMKGGLLLKDSDVRRDERTGLPRKIRGEFPLPAGDTAEDSVRAFLEQSGDELALKADKKSLKLTQEVTTPTGRVVRFQQLHEGIPVVDSSVVVQVDKANRVKSLDLSHVRATVAETRVTDTSLTPKEAVKKALESLGNPALRQKMTNPERVYWPSPEGLRLAYMLIIPTRQPPHDWRIIVDAFSGDVLEQKDLIMTIDGTGMVFDPNPVVTANDNAYRDPDATAAACGFTGTARATIDLQRVSRSLRDIALSGGTHKLEGPFARARNFGAPNLNAPEESNEDNFNYSSGDNRFEWVNVYYHIDTLQRYIQSLGITTANNRQIEYDAHDNSLSAAWYSPADQGLHFYDSGPCRPDRGEDGHVVYHEYGHAIQDNQVPGWGATNPTTGRRETRAMGEGFGDALACVFFATFGGGYLKEQFEQWVFVDQGGLRRVDGTKVYPGSWVNQEHSDGEIWSAALWNIYRSIGGDSMSLSERLSARDALLKTVILSHHRLLANASMPDGAEAVMDENAALDDFRGRHLIEMLNSFHDRGLLHSNAGVDLYIRDDASDPGVDAFTGSVFWDSPDLWIRNNDDNGTTHQSPEFGQDNWFYARVRNRGSQTARAFVVTLNVKPWAGTQFVYPNDWMPYISAAVGYNLAPGGTTVVKARWPAALVPSVGTHACWLASVYTPIDFPPAGHYVWQHNNLAQKNLTVVDLIAGDSAVINFQVGNRFQLQPERFRIEVRRPQEWTSLPVAVVHKSPEVLKSLLSSFEEVRPTSPVTAVQPQPVIRFLDPSRIEIAHRGFKGDPVRLNLNADSTLDIAPMTPEPEVSSAQFGDPGSGIGVNIENAGAAIPFKAGLLTSFPIGLQPRTPVQLGLRVTAPPDAKPGDVIKIHLMQRNTKNEVVGGFALQMNIIRK
jgi:hypothetical protein